jgi:hypothetical protein
MVHMHVLSSSTLSIKDYDIKDVAGGLQEFIICLEMFAAALAHQIAFPASEFGNTVPAEGSKLSSVLDVLDMSDVYNDVRDRAENMGGRMVGRIKGTTMGALGVAPARSKVKLDVEDDDDVGEGVAAGMRLLSVGTERSDAPGAQSANADGVVGGVELRADRANMPFLAASSHQRRAVAASAGAASAAGDLEQALSPRTLAPSASTSTVSIGGVQIQLRDLLETSALSPNAARAVSPRSASPQKPSPQWMQLP